ncbi:MAG: multidrug effflux MFS transporter [Rhodobacteraceae bacterium]|nr:multidrug effflux MFS transporter [Paracoccaceae bacterium]
MTARFIVLVALLTSLLAFGTDAMLPALPEIGKALGVIEANRVQLVITSFMLGTGLGQLFFGPFSDYIGRKPAILLGLAIFMAGAAVSYTAQSFEMMLAGRMLQGLGVAGPRTASIAMVRDLYKGREMARIMSFVMTVFILVPALAPLLGQEVMLFWGWRSIFVSFILFAMVAFLWMAFGQAETNTQRRRFSLADLWQSATIVFTNRQTMGFALVAGLNFAGFVVYLSSAEQIFREIFHVGRLFPLYFAIMALAIGAASILNARLVMRLGMHILVTRALTALVGFSLLYSIIIFALPEAENLWFFLTWGVFSFFSVGLVFGNVNALAMEPMGANAGIAAAIIGAVSTVLAVAIGVPLGLLYNGTTLPLVAAFPVLGLGCLTIIRLTPRST